MTYKNLGGPLVTLTAAAHRSSTSAVDVHWNMECFVINGVLWRNWLHLFTLHTHTHSNAAYTYKKFNV